ncbi:glycosyltransferase family 8 protein [Hoeflea sp. TYP-13]|uniref:glycosyltransferase family 8 protein n=1 Tax=Hoeflea sp. TYP-13 TaxID=3230023 RepID=UPI0034C6D6BE
MAFHIVAATDNNCVGPLSCMIKSLSVSNSHLIPVVHVLESDLTDANKTKLLAFSRRLGLRVQFTNIAAQQFVEIDSHLAPGHISAASLYRCVMGSVLPGDIERVLYLDVDTLVLAPLDELIGFDMKGKTAAVVRERMSHLSKYGVASDQYFNSGVMLIDLVEWRRQNIGETALAHLRNAPDDMLWKDQCALNLSLKDNTVSLEDRFNYMERDRPTHSSFMLPNILHFAGAAKPWTDPQSLPWGVVYCKVSESTPWPVDYHAQQRSSEEIFRNKSWLRRRIIKTGRKLARI